MNIVAMPILLPLAAAAICLGLWGKPRAQSVAAAVAQAATLAAAIILFFKVRSEGILVLHAGDWGAPIGISFVADLLAVVMVLLGAIVGLAVMVYSIAATSDRNAGNGHYPLCLCLLAAVSGSFLAGDIFNLYVWFELMLLSSFVLLTLGGERGQLEGGIKYVTLNLVSSAIFLIGVAFLYGVTGTLNMAHLSIRLDNEASPALATALGSLLLISFGIKAAVFPFFFWLPASYHTPPVAVSALFSGLLTKVGVYALIRACTLIFDQEPGIIGNAVLLVAGLTMLTGVLGAVAQNDIRRILSFHIVSQIGYMLMGLGVAIVVVSKADPNEAVPQVAALALAGSVFYIIHHIIVKTNLFLIAGAVLQRRGTTNLKKLGGMMGTDPALAALFFVTAMALAGIPVLSGFWAKLVLVRGGLEAGSYPIVAVSLTVSILTLLSMTKIWVGAFWGEAPPADENTKDPHVSNKAQTSIGMRWCLTAPIVVLAALAVLIGVAAGPIYDVSRAAADQLLNPEDYIRTVLPAELIAAERGAFQSATAGTADTADIADTADAAGTSNAAPAPIETISGGR